MHAALVNHTYLLETLTLAPERELISASLAPCTPRMAPTRWLGTASSMVVLAERVSAPPMLPLLRPVSHNISEF